MSRMLARELYVANGDVDRATDIINIYVGQKEAEICYVSPYSAYTSIAVDVRNDIIWRMIWDDMVRNKINCF